ncbi:hypothetical protein KM043_002725 [Ampulex compressa]|nr:hypothetical protein KM043_002725 [Ampulex compressa]
MEKGRRLGWNERRNWRMREEAGRRQGGDESLDGGGKRGEREDVERVADRSYIALPPAPRQLGGLIYFLIRSFQPHGPPCNGLALLTHAELTPSPATPAKPTSSSPEDCTPGGTAGQRLRGIFDADSWLVPRSIGVQLRRTSSAEFEAPRFELTSELARNTGRSIDIGRFYDAFRILLPSNNLVLYLVPYRIIR